MKPSLPTGFTLTGSDVKRLMRTNSVTMRSIKQKHGITLKRIREVRERGAAGFFAEEWIWIITGNWPKASPSL